MLSLESLIKYLEPNQVNLSERVVSTNMLKNGNTTGKKNHSLENLSDIYNDYFLENKCDFTFYRNKNISKNEFFNFVNSILVSLDNNYGILQNKNKMLKIKLFLKELIVDFDKRNLYYEYNYNKNRKIKKQPIQEFLQNCLRETHKFIGKLEKYFIDQLICDYFGLNVVLFNVVNGVIDEENSKIIYTTKYENKFNKFVPTLFISRNGDEYNSIMKKNGDVSFVRYSENKDLLNNVFRKFNICINRRELEVLSINELRDKCLENGIEITKISSQSGNKINKRKGELIDEMGTLDFV